MVLVVLNIEVSSLYSSFSWWDYSCNKYKDDSKIEKNFYSFLKDDLRKKFILLLILMKEK